MKNEARYEINAAKQRVAAAKASSAMATENLESTESTVKDTVVVVETAEAMTKQAILMMQKARESMDSAESSRCAAKLQVENTMKEVEEATKALEESEKRWDVIVLDSDEENESQDDKNSSKKQNQLPGLELMLSATDSEDTDANERIFDAIETDSGSPNNESGTSTNTNRTRVVGINVDNGGIEKARGTYKRADDADIYKPYYRRSGIWKGRPQEFVMFYRDSNWYIGVWHTRFFSWTGYDSEFRNRLSLCCTKLG